MRLFRSRAAAASCAVLAAALFAFPALAGRQEKEGPGGLGKLVPKVTGWQPAEAARLFSPANLFEYIDGAAESYLSYDFKELLAVEFDRPGAEASITLEIYDMGSPIDAFGIFGAERYPENPPVAVGDVGYMEGEALNFAAGRYYVKLLAFGLGDETGAVLVDFARKVAGAVPGTGGLPSVLGRFPRGDIVPRSEKFIRRNFMGYEFLHDGFTADYRVDGQELEGFIVEGASENDAETMLGRLLEALAAGGQAAEKIVAGYHVKNRYGQHLFVGRVGSLLYGVMRVPAGLEGAGEAAFRKLADSLAERPARRPGTRA